MRAPGPGTGGFPAVRGRTSRIQGAWTAAALVVSGATAAPGQVLTTSTVATVGGANGLSTPAARHLLRMDPAGRAPTYLLALQRDDALPDPGLGFYRSDDDGQSWSLMKIIDGISAERQTADVLKAGDDVALVHSFDGSSILPDAVLDPTRKAYFQWWRYDGAGGWTDRNERVVVFAPTPGAAYHRAELAVDSSGRIWVQAFKRGTSACDPAADRRCAACWTVDNGDNYANEMVVSVSTDGGRTFRPEQRLDTTLCRAGGRLISLGHKLLLLWNDYSENESGTRAVTRFMLRDDQDPLASWGAPSQAFPDDPADGIFHGAALSAVADGSGGLHLVYKDHNQRRLWYRRFDGAKGSFGPRTLVDDSVDDWALQPTTTLRGGELYVFANHVLAAASYETRMWKLSKGLGPTLRIPLGADSAFHGYPSTPETLPAGARSLPYLFGRTPDENAPGVEVALRINIAASVALTRPASGSVISGSVALAAEAEVSPGTSPIQTRFFVDGHPIGIAAASQTALTWDTTAVANGGHELSAEVADASGNLAVSPPVRVEVRNSGTSGGCSSTAGVGPMLAVLLLVGLAGRRRSR